MKILILGYLDKGALEHAYISELRNCGVDCEAIDVNAAYFEAIGKSLGHRVYNKIHPSHYFGSINNRVMASIDKRHFDVILVFKGFTLFPDTIKQLKEHARLLCCYNPDHPFEYYSRGSGNANVYESISLYDVYISYASAVVGALKHRFSVESFVLPFGFRNDFEVTYSASHSHILFIGAHDRQRARRLQRIHINSLRIYGERKWSSRTLPGSYLRRHYAGPSVYDQSYAALVSGANGVLNFLRKQNIVEQSHNMRTFEVPGYGGVLIAERTDEQQSFFEEGKEAFFFDTDEELKDKVHFLNQHPDVVLQVKRNARERSLRSGYDYKSRTNQLLDGLRKYF